MLLRRFSAAQMLSWLLPVLLLSGLALAQDVQMVPDQQDKDSATKAQSQKDEDKDEQPLTTFKANVDVVQLFFNVKDKKGGLIRESAQGKLSRFLRTVSRKPSSTLRRSRTCRSPWEF